MLLVLAAAAALAVPARADGVRELLVKIDPAYDARRPDWRAAALGNLILHRMSGMDETPQDAAMLAELRKTGKDRLLPPKGSDPALLGDLQCRVGMNGCERGLPGYDSKAPDHDAQRDAYLRALIDSNERFLQGRVDKLQSSVASASPSSTQDSPSQGPPSPQSSRGPLAGGSAPPSSSESSLPSPGGNSAAFGPQGSGDPGISGGGSGGSGGPGGSPTGLGGHDIGRGGLGGAMGDANKGFAGKKDDLAGPRRGGSASPAPGGPQASRGPSAGKSAETNASAGSPRAPDAPPSAGRPYAAGSAGAPSTIAFPPAAPGAVAAAGPSSAGGPAPSSGLEGGPPALRAPAIDKKEKPAGSGDDKELTEAERKELAEIQRLLKEAADKGSLDGPKLEDALAALPNDGSPALSEIEQKVARMLGMVGRELTMAERQAVLALASELELSAAQSSALPPAVENGVPPPAGKLGARRRGPRGEIALLFIALGLLAAAYLALKTRSSEPS